MANSYEAMRDILHSIRLLGDWDLIFFSEVDGTHANEGLVIDEQQEAVAPHLFMRHYSGPGNSSMGLIIHSRLQHCLRNVTWCERAVCCILRSANMKELQFVGLHGYSVENAEETLGMCGRLLQQVGHCRNRQIVMAGDWNIDLLPQLDERLQASQDVEAANAMLTSFSDAFACELYYPPSDMMS